MLKPKEDTGNFWQDHAEHFLEMAFATERMERLDHADGYGRRTGTCGDTIEIFLTMADNRIERARFAVNGCLNTSACANTVTLFAEGKTVAEAWKITEKQVAEYLQTLPSDHAHCAELAVGAFYLALADYQRKQSGAPAAAESLSPKSPEATLH